MYNYLRLSLVSALVLFTSALIAQTNGDNDQSLLWRISGKGLTKPSYLFGTIHLTDRRLFRHDDSVFAAIDNSEGLAIELNPNEMSAYYLNKMLDDADDDKKIGDLMEEKELSKYEQLFRKRFGKSAKDVTTKDLIREKNKWVSHYMNKGGMPTFLDAYLYTIANRQGKWTGGIEDVQDQMSIADRTDINLLAVSDEPTNVETLINLYINSDLRGINNIINKYNPAYKDALLTRRNLKMARRMDSLSQSRSMFFAVGAAHLPGDSGVINMLRARGFTVEPVHASHKTDADKYVFKNQGTDRWVDVIGEKALYTVQMPGEAITVSMYGLIDMKYLADFSDMTGYMTMAIVGTNDIEDPEEVAEKYGQRVFSKKKIKKSDISTGDIRGYEMTDQSNSGYIRLRVFVKGKVVYIASASGRSMEKLKSEKVERYFASYAVKPAVQAEEHIYVLSYPEFAYKITSPVQLSFNEKLTKQSDLAKEWRIKVYSGQDDATGSYIMFTGKDVAPGYFIPSDSSVLDDIFLGLNSRCEGTKKDTTILGLNAMIFTCQQKGDIHMKLLSVVRGNRNLNFALVTNNELKDNERLNSIFTSLELLPYKTADWQTRASDENSVSSYAPAAIVTTWDSVTDESTTYGKRGYYSYDSMSATTYRVVIDTLDKYTWTQDVRAFLKEKQSAYVDETFVMLSEKMTTTGKEKSREIVYKEPNATVHRRLKTIYHNNILYHLFCTAEKNIVESQNAERFFSEFTINSKELYDLHNNKAVTLLQDMKSGDSATSATALLAISNTYFTQSDRQVLYATLLDTLPEIRNAALKPLAGHLIKQKIDSYKDTGIVSFVKEHYPKGNEAVRFKLLSVLPNILTENSYNTMFRLLAQYPLSSDHCATLAFMVNDSLPLLKYAYPEINKLITDTASVSLAAGITNDLIDSGMVSLLSVKDLAATYASTTMKLIANNKNSDNWKWTDHSLLDLLDTINTVETINALKEVLQTKDIYIKSRAAVILAKKNINVQPEVWQSIASSADMRTVLYSSLKRIDKELLFPKQYATQSLFAESEIYGIANDDGDAATVTLLDEKVASVNGKKHKFYLYKVSYTADKGSYSYLGIAGGYDTHAKLLQTEADHSGIYWEEQYNGQNINDLFAAYIQSLENDSQGE